MNFSINDFHLLKIQAALFRNVSVQSNSITLNRKHIRPPFKYSSFNLKNIFYTLFPLYKATKRYKKNRIRSNVFSVHHLRKSKGGGTGGWGYPNNISQDGAYFFSHCQSSCSRSICHVAPLSLLAKGAWLTMCSSGGAPRAHTRKMKQCAPHSLMSTLRARGKSRAPNYTRTLES